MQKRKTPCIGICSTGIGDSVCRGCKRFAHEIIHWNGYDDSERGAILDRIEALLVQVVTARVLVLDADQLQVQAQAHRLRLPASCSEARLVYESLRKVGKSMPGLEAIGCRAVAPWDRLSPDELRADIESSFYQISCAHYERFFPGHL